MAIQTRDLVVQFPGQREPTLKNISLTVPDGSFAVLVGASGSGKSTCCTAWPASSPRLRAR